MENLSSSELDSPSKTPLFIAISAVLVALVSLALGWMGLSRATALEAEIKRLEEAASADTGLEQSVQANTDRIQKLAEDTNKFSKGVSDALKAANTDIKKSQSDIRKVMMTAGEAKKMVMDLEKKGVKVAVVPSSSSTTSSSKPSTSTQPAAQKAPDAKPGKAGVYTIKSGDNFSKIAAAYKVTLSQLQAANPGIDSRRLRIGQQIVIPAPSN
ncbi:LysM peptidoglycan-binding domain-containing protein [Pelagicoccus mobilis]|uniref:LysM peptidoglycan-binding domain-containing protein n=1 Tax=Pelagicoccus mobilis TaxID=415221 RepID=A0A934RV00_9BACT|nr:LysM domain-containing protein [Pelagicoccus mobilis]MBK1878155.1 LysM peptidoglycan-binding domain-containing protein [Pelagicoccus mobilis]